MHVFENIISDRGSKYAVSGGPCASEAEAKGFLKELQRRKKFAKATHNSWGLLTADGPLKGDDGESGAGMVILRPRAARCGRGALQALRHQHPHRDRRRDLRPGPTVRA